MQTKAFAVILAAAAGVSAAPAPVADPTLSWLALFNWFNWFGPKAIPAWPPAAPYGCLPKWPYPQVSWTTIPKKCPGIPPKKPSPTVPPKYPNGCDNNGGNTNFTLACPVKPMGSIADGQLQCNSPYPAMAAVNSDQALVDTKFYLTDGALFDQLGRACEISGGYQLQCNYISDNSAAMKGFSLNSGNQLLWQGENTWYGCNIGTSYDYGQILFTGTHLDFNGVQSATDNPNCAAFRLTAAYVN